MNSPSDEADSNRRAARRGQFAAEVRQLWRDYLVDTDHDDIPGGIPYLPELPDRLIQAAIGIVNHAVTLSDLTKLDDVRLADVGVEREKTLDFISKLAKLDQFEMRSYLYLLEPNKIHVVQAFDELARELYMRARDLKASWRQIGEREGMTAEGARKRAADKGWTFGFADTEA